MKNNFLLFFCFFFIQTISSQSQDTLIGVNLKHLHRIEESFKNSPEIPRSFLKGSVLSIETDKVFVINERRYTYYKKLEELRDLIETDNQDSIISALIRHYESSLDSCRTYYSLLWDNAKKTDIVSQKLVDETKSVAQSSILTLNSATGDLANANKKLDESLIHLAEAEKLIKKSMRIKWLDRIIIGAACLAIGYAVGSL